MLLKLCAQPKKKKNKTNLLNFKNQRPDFKSNPEQFQYEFGLSESLMSHKSLYSERSFCNKGK